MISGPRETPGRGAGEWAAGSIEPDDPAFDPRGDIAGGDDRFDGLGDRQGAGVGVHDPLGAGELRSRWFRKIRRRCNRVTSMFHDSGSGRPSFPAEAGAGSAKAGIHFNRQSLWIPSFAGTSFAGMTGL